MAAVPRLRVESSPDAHRNGTSVNLTSFPFTLGRSSDCLLAIADESASRRHVEIHRAEQGVWILDLGSVNGTKVNGTRVDKAWLAHGDRIEIGRTTLIFEVAEDAPAALPPLPPLPPLPGPPVAPGPVSGRRRSPATWVAVGSLAVIAIVAVAGVAWWWRPAAPGGSDARHRASATAPDRELVALDLGIARAVPLEVIPGRELGAATIRADRGGTVEARDGLVIRVPPRALPDTRRITIREARVPDPEGIAALIGGGEARLETLASWEIDAGPAADPFPGEVEVTAVVAEGSVPLYAAISIDGVRWSRVATTVDGNRVTFRTRHFCPVTIVGLLQATGVVLPVVATAYLVVNRADELPSRFHPYAPFVGVDVNPKGFQIFWSKSLRGVDRRTGFKDERRYVAEVERVVRDYSAAGARGGAEAVAMTAEINALKRAHLMPDKVREVEEALRFAESYLASRKIAVPALSLPVYVVPTLGKDAGMIHNPWAGRRYMMVGADAGREIVWTTALHELFHHYQFGYVWLDRTSHLPFLEASALLMEREAIPAYAAAGKPFNAGEGLVLAQMLVFRNGLDGPREWKEQYVRMHGYGLTWFLEYLRDEKYAGPGSAKDPEAFHAALLTEWGRRWTGALHKGLQWAAGSERELASAWLEFARTKVLEGRVDTCGSQTPYGRMYKSCPLMDSPYAAHSEYGLPASKLDLARTPVVTIGDDAIRPWSIQFYEITARGVPKSVAVLRVPRAWLPATGPSRGVFLRQSADHARPDPIADVDLAAASHPDAYATLPAGAPSYAYVVDTGQSGSGWFSSNSPMTVFLLGPPTGVRAKVSGKTATITWSPPAAAATPGLVHAVRVHGAGGKAVRTVPISATSVDLAIDSSPLTIRLASAVEIGRDASGEPMYLESPLSDPVTVQAEADPPARPTAPADRVEPPSAPRRGSWVFEGFASNDWAAALARHNQGTSGWTLSVTASQGAATFVNSYTGSRTDSWMRKGMSETGSITYTPPGGGTLEPDGKVAITITVTNAPRAHGNFYGIAAASAGVVRLDAEGRQRGNPGWFRAADGATTVGYVSGRGSVTQAPVTKVFEGAVPAGSVAGERLAIRVQLSGGGLQVNHDFVFRWTP